MRIYAGWTPQAITSRLEAKYGKIDNANKAAIFDHADRGLAAGRVVTAKILPFSSLKAKLAAKAQGQHNVYMSDVFKPGVSDDIESFDTGEQNLGQGQVFSFDDLPILTELFGDNPQHWRALAILAVSGLLTGGELRADLYLNGGETVEQIIERAIAWRFSVSKYSPERFEGMDTDEQIELSIQIVAGWRPF